MKILLNFFLFFFLMTCHIDDSHIMEDYSHKYFIRVIKEKGVIEFELLDSENQRIIGSCAVYVLKKGSKDSIWRYDGQYKNPLPYGHYDLERLKFHCDKFKKKDKKMYGLCFEDYCPTANAVKLSKKMDCTILKEYEKKH